MVVLMFLRKEETRLFALRNYYCLAKAERNSVVRNIELQTLL